MSIQDGLSLHCECGNDLEEFKGRPCLFCKIEYCGECIASHEEECIEKFL